MERLGYTKNTNELVSSLQSQLDLLAQETQKNLAGTQLQKIVYSWYTNFKKLKFEDHCHCWAKNCLPGNYGPKLKDINDENKKMLEESIVCSQQLLSSLTNVSQDTGKRSEFKTAQI
ncbi:hypothetical protein QYF61_025640, partial [Mycteria americana]